MFDFWGRFIINKHSNSGKLIGFELGKAMKKIGLATSICTVFLIVFLTTPQAEPQQDIQVPPPPLSEDTFPCMECHADMDPNPERRELEEFHDDIEFTHDEENRWCMDCHDLVKRDFLHLADGSLVSFNESYLVCGQCHGPKLRDWQKGIHGKSTGNWNGEKQYLLCAHCHNPHAPSFKSMPPLPPPHYPKNSQGTEKGRKENTDHD